MIDVIGKMYSTPTESVLRYLDNLGVTYTFHELDEDKLSDEDKWSKWLISNKIIALPVVKIGSRFTVGNDTIAIKKLIDSAKSNH